MTPQISPERLSLSLTELAQIGGRPDGGVDRLAGTAADVEARRWLAGRMRAAGLEADLDDVNNVFGHPPGGAPGCFSAPIPTPCPPADGSTAPTA